MNSPSSIDVHRLAPPEWSVLRRLRLNALRDSPQAFLGDPQTEAARSPEEWQVRMQNRVWFAAASDGRPVGLGSTVRDPDTDERYVESMWVEPDSRGRGVASAVLRAVEHLAVSEGKTVLLLWVLDGNPSAAEVYRRYGFRESGVRQSISGHPELIETQFRLSVPSRPIVVTTPLIFAAR